MIQRPQRGSGVQVGVAQASRVAARQWQRGLDATGGAGQTVIDEMSGIQRRKHRRALARLKHGLDAGRELSLPPGD